MTTGNYQQPDGQTIELYSLKMASVQFVGNRLCLIVTVSLRMMQRSCRRVQIINNRQWPVLIVLIGKANRRTAMDVVVAVVKIIV